MKTRVWLTSLVMLTALLGCGGDTETDADLLDRVVSQEAKVRSLIHAEGCASVDQCRSAPMGAKGCGGPREYVVYCSVTTNEPALLAAIDAETQAERAYNGKTGAVSDCLFVMPPVLELAGGVCQRAGTSPSVTPSVR
jgi:hypothetical protein